MREHKDVKYKRKGKSLKKDNFISVKNSFDSFMLSPTSIVNFVEGTRFNDIKAKKKYNYSSLLLTRNFFMF